MVEMMATASVDASMDTNRPQYCQVHPLTLGLEHQDGQQAGNGMHGSREVCKDVLGRSTLVFMVEMMATASLEASMDTNSPQYCRVPLACKSTHTARCGSSLHDLLS